MSAALFVRVAALSDVSNGADPLDETAGLVTNGVRDHLQVFDGAVLELHAAIELELPARSAEHAEKQRQVFRVDAVTHRARRHRLARIESADPAGFFRQSQFVGRGAVAETARRAQALCSRQLRLASSERLFGLCAFDRNAGNVRESPDEVGLQRGRAADFALIDGERAEGSPCLRQDRRRPA